MPQAALTDQELWKKTLRTTLVMVGSTALWLAALSGAVVLSTGSGAPDKAGSKGDKGDKVEKVEHGTAPGSSGGAVPSRGPGLGAPPRMGRHGGPAVPPKPESPHPGDAI
jgi:hypothetical protein